MRDTKESYPFIVRGQRDRLIKVLANDLSNAVDRVVSKYPNKFIKTKFARSMDLISAKVEAAKKSKDTAKPVYINADAEGECELSDKQTDGTQCVYVNGHEDKTWKPVDMMIDTGKKETTKKTIPAQSKKALEIIAKATIKKEEVMKPAKKAAKKAAKKVAAKKATPVKKETKRAGEKKTLKISEIITRMNKGEKIYRQSTGGKLSLVHMKAAKDKDHTLPVTIVK